MNLSIEHNKNLFVSYVGLTIGGYTLAESKENNKLLEMIRGVQWDKDIVAYFSEARTNTCEVNPYYPRAFFLTLASLYIVNEDRVFYDKFDELHKYINDLEVNPIEKDANAIEWIKKLPYYFTKVISNKNFKGLWDYYLLYVESNDLITKKVLDSAVLRIMESFKIGKDDLFQIIVLPNKLQAPQATDVVYMENLVYIIKSEPDEESIIHEYLHSILDKYLHENKLLINQYLHLLKPVLDDMMKYQYAWDYGIDSWNRVFEESFMRAASLWVCNNNDIETAISKAIRNACYGFTYVPIILENFIHRWTTFEDFKEFLKTCLNECESELKSI